jgi:RNA polymerase sigma factor (sigma-70 family)
MAISDDPFAIAIQEEMCEEANSTVTFGNAYGEQSLNNEPLDLETLYTSYREMLEYVAVQKFRVPETDVENLIQEVFLSYLQTETRVENVRAWLVAAMCNACRFYWRRQGRYESLPDDIDERPDPLSEELADKMALQMTMSSVMSYMQPVCREVLRLHYYEGRSAVEVARELSTTTRYAEKLIHNCLRRARELYQKFEHGKTS